jgi:hypothetical protein
MEIQRVHGNEDHDIGTLTKEGCARIQRSLNYWKELSTTSKDKLEKKWKICT